MNLNHFAEKYVERIIERMNHQTICEPIQTNKYPDTIHWYKN